MSQIALHTVFINPEQAKKAIAGQIAPYCKQLWAQGVERIAVTLQPEEDAKSARQRRYYHGVVLKEISEQATSSGQKFAIAVWKEYFRDKYLGYDWEHYIELKTQKKRRRKVRLSTEDLGVKAYSKLIEQVTAEAVTDLGVQFSVRQEDYR
jgi:hypothetical protein